MKVTLKTVLGAALVCFTLATNPVMQKIVAYKAKGFRPEGYSAIQLYQNDKLVSSATFQERTDKRYAKFYNPGAGDQTALYFDTEQGALTIRFCHTGPKDITGQCSFDVDGDSAVFNNLSAIREDSSIKISWLGDRQYKPGAYLIEIKGPKAKRKFWKRG